MIVNLAEFEAKAREQIDAAAWDYYASGANDEITLRDNRAAFDRIRLYYRVLVDVSQRDLATRVLNTDVALPVIVAPTAFHALAHPEGELATVRGASAVGTIMILSTLSNTRVEDVTQAASGPVWFQLYVYRDRGVTEALIRRVEAAGCEALVVTVDAPQLGRRERDVRNRFQLPPHLCLENLLPAGLQHMPAETTGSGLAAYFASLIDPSLNWSDLAWLQSITTLPIVIKGIVRTDDARRAVDGGAAALVVSNHGGRQLDSAPATIDVVGSIADAVGNRADVFMDGGIRRGTDVIKALAYGAKAVLLGRPILWGLGVDGENGVKAVLQLLHAEIDAAMALCGCPTIAAIDRTLVEPEAKVRDQTTLV